MNDLRKAAQQALEALEYENDFHKHRKESPYGSTTDAMKALRAALAIPEPLEPAGEEDMKVYAAIAKNYTKRKPLTDEEIYKMFGWYAIPFARAVERAHGIGGEYEAN